jgi:hypothetical protein
VPRAILSLLILSTPSPMPHAIGVQLGTDVVNQDPANQVKLPHSPLADRSPAPHSSYSSDSANGTQADGGTARLTVSPCRNRRPGMAATRRTTSLPTTWIWQSTASPR